MRPYGKISIDYLSLMEAANSIKLCGRLVKTTTRGIVSTKIKAKLWNKWTMNLTA